MDVVWGIFNIKKILDIQILNLLYIKNALKLKIKKKLYLGTEKRRALESETNI